MEYKNVLSTLSMNYERYNNNSLRTLSNLNISLVNESVINKSRIIAQRKQIKHTRIFTPSEKASDTKKQKMKNNNEVKLTLVPTINEELYYENSF